MAAQKVRSLAAFTAAPEVQAVTLVPAALVGRVSVVTATLVPVAAVVEVPAQTSLEV